MHTLHHFFDLDGTIVERGGKITGSVVTALRALPSVVIVSGATYDKVCEQLSDLRPRYFVLAENGTQIWKEGTCLGSEPIDLTTEERMVITAHAVALSRASRAPDVGAFDWRIGVANFSLLHDGLDAKLKRDFDPTNKHRIALLDELPLGRDWLECAIGGRTSFDYTRTGFTKGDNVRRLIERQGWNPYQCCYYGDGFFRHGNDLSVAGVIPTVPVSGPDSLLPLIS